MRVHVAADDRYSILYQTGIGPTINLNRGGGTGGREGVGGSINLVVNILMARGL